MFYGVLSLKMTPLPSTTDGFTQINPFPFVLETKVATCLNSATFSATALSGWMTVNGPNNSGALQYWTHGSPWCCPLNKSGAI